MIPPREACACFTGHRSLPSGAPREDIVRSLDAVIAAAVSRGLVNFWTGGAVGFDTLAACRVIAASKKVPEVKLHLALPCRNQTEKWQRMDDLVLYKQIMSAADSVEYMGDFYTAGCMHERNRFMVDHSSLCIAYCTKRSGGTFYTVEYARANGIAVQNLAECVK